MNKAELIIQIPTNLTVFQMLETIKVYSQTICKENSIRLNKEGNY